MKTDDIGTPIIVRKTAIGKYIRRYFSKVDFASKKGWGFYPYSEIGEETKYKNTVFIDLQYKDSNQNTHTTVFHSLLNDFIDNNIVDIANQINICIRIFPDPYPSDIRLLLTTSLKKLGSLEDFEKFQLNNGKQFINLYRYIKKNTIGSHRFTGIFVAFMYAKGKTVDGPKRAIAEYDCDEWMNYTLTNMYQPIKPFFLETPDD